MQYDEPIPHHILRLNYVTRINIFSSVSGKSREVRLSMVQAIRSTPPAITSITNPIPASSTRHAAGFAISGASRRAP